VLDFSRDPLPVADGEIRHLTAMAGSE
jgi:hypothetical protein